MPYIWYPIQNLVMKRLLLFLFSLLCIPLIGLAQENSGTALPVTPIIYNSLTPPACSATSSLGTGSVLAPGNAATGTMANDSWYSFTAPAKGIKIRVCNPNFDASIELYNAGGAPTLVTNGFKNTAGNAGSEFLCINTLTTGNNYLIRVGRASGTGAGTFGLSLQYNPAYVQAGWAPGPSGGPCYQVNVNIKRNVPPVTTTSTQWLFVDEDTGITYGPCTATGGTYNLSGCPDLCSGKTYITYCQVQTNDSECGSFWWGYSTPTTIEMCTDPTTGILNPPSGSTITFNSLIDITAIGPNTTQYQIRFITDNGNTVICGPWQIGGNFNTSQIANYLRYNKIYQVSVRVWLACSATPGAWSTPFTYLTPTTPYIPISSSNCNKWRTFGGGFYSADAQIGIDNYRFRFIPINPTLNAGSPCTPTGPAVVTNWTSQNFTALTGIGLTTNQIYMVSAQGRKNVTTGTSACGNTLNIPGQQVDWGVPCFLGIVGGGSPAAGTVININCSAGMALLPDGNNQHFDVDLSVNRVLGVINATSQGNKMLAVDLTGSNLHGDGLLRIFSSSGQLIFEKRIADAEYSNFIEVNLQQLASAGLYIITVQTADGYLTDKLFIQGD
jgi:hypothetical protein